MTGTSAPTGPGPVALVGSGEFLPAMEPVDAALLAGRPTRAVFLPTAAGPEGPERVDYWLRLGADHYRRLGADPVGPRADPDRDRRGDGAGRRRRELAGRGPPAGLDRGAGRKPGPPRRRNVDSVPLLKRCGSHEPKEAIVPTFQSPEEVYTTM